MNLPLHVICHRCEHRSPPPYSGVMRCTLNGKDILENEAARECPAGKFDLGLGDQIARVLYSPPLAPITKAAKRCIERVRRGPCGCDGRDGRRQKLNRRFPKK